MKYSNTVIGFKHLWRIFYTGRHLIFFIILLSLSAVGIIYSFHIGPVQRILGILPIAAPGLFSIWQTLSILKVSNENVDTSVVSRWFVFTTFFGSIPLVLTNMLMALGAWFIPANQTLIASQTYSYWWEDSLQVSILQIGFAGYITQVLSSLAMFLIVILPIISRKNNSFTITESNFYDTKSKKFEKKLNASIFTSISICVIGTIMAGFTKGLFLDTNSSFSSILTAVQSIPRIWDEAKLIVTDISYGFFKTEHIVWLLGILMMVIGILSFFWDVYQMYFGKEKDTNDD